MLCVPLQEFAAKGSFIQYGGVVDHALVVRGITTVYNTDYMTDFVFHLNAEIQVLLPTDIKVVPLAVFTDHAQVNTSTAHLGLLASPAPGLQCYLPKKCWRRAVA